MDKLDEIKTFLKQRVREELDLSREMRDEEVKELIYRIIAKERENRYFSVEQREQLAKDIFASVRELDILQELVDDDSITEIMVNGPKDIFIEKDGHISRWSKNFESQEKLEDVIQQMVAGCNRVVNESSPIVDARLSNGSRVNVVLKPVALNGPIVTIRRFLKTALSMEDYIGLGSVTREASEFLKNAVRSRYNILVSGGTGSGKTTLLNILSQYIPVQERVVTIEDSAELQLQGVTNLVRLETRNANREGCGEISQRELIKSALRMRPDRIVVGEVRGAESFDLLQAFNTGHDGGLSSLHSNSAVDALTRLEMMILMAKDLPVSAIRRQIASGIDLIVHISRLRNGSRKVVEIVELVGIEGNEIATSTLFSLENSTDEKGSLVAVNGLRRREKWISEVGYGI